MQSRRIHLFKPFQGIRKGILARYGSILHGHAIPLLRMRYPPVYTPCKLPGVPFRIKAFRAEGITGRADQGALPYHGNKAFPCSFKAGKAIHLHPRAVYVEIGSPLNVGKFIMGIKAEDRLVPEDAVHDEFFGHHPILCLLGALPGKTQADAPGVIAETHGIKKRFRRFFIGKTADHENIDDVSWNDFRPHRRFRRNVYAVIDNMQAGPGSAVPEIIPYNFRRALDIRAAVVNQPVPKPHDERSEEALLAESEVCKDIMRIQMEGGHARLSFLTGYLYHRILQEQRLFKMNDIGPPDGFPDFPAVYLRIRETVFPDDGLKEGEYKMFQGELRSEPVLILFRRRHQPHIMSSLPQSPHRIINSGSYSVAFVEGVVANQ